MTKVFHVPAIIAFLDYTKKKEMTQLEPQEEITPIIAAANMPDDIVSDHQNYIPLYETYEEKLFRIQEEQELKKYDQIRIANNPKEEVKLKEFEQQLLLMRRDKLLRERVEGIRNRKIGRLNHEEISELKREQEIYKLSYEMIERKSDEIEKIKFDEALKNRKALEKNKLIYEEQLEKAKKIED